MTRAAYLARLAAQNPEALRVSADLQEEIMSADRTEMESTLLDFATALAAVAMEETPETLERHRAALSAVESLAVNLLQERRAQVRTLSAARRGTQSGWHVGRSGER